MRIALVSDTHIAARARAFTANWHIAARLIEAERPDLIIHLGDITVDGAGDPAEHGQALDAMQALSAPRLAVPGNHDLGDNPPHPGAHVSSPVTPARLAAWARVAWPLGPAWPAWPGRLGPPWPGPAWARLAWPPGLA